MCGTRLLSRPSCRRVAGRLAACAALAALAASCASLVSTATSGMADNLGAAIRNQDDPETVRDGAPAYLLMMDSFVEGSPEDATMLATAAELYAAYGIVFVDEDDRSRRLTRRSLNYARRAMCAVDADHCEFWTLPYPAFEEEVSRLREHDGKTVFTLAISWLAYIQAHRDDWSALADLPKVEAVFIRAGELAPAYRTADREHYLGVLNTLRPPALGGDFEEGRDHYERAIALTDGRDLMVKVNFANYYARTLYDRELHDRLLHEVLETDPDYPGLTLFNTLAQREARAMLASADEYF